MAEPMPARLDQHITRFFELSSEAMAVADSRGQLKKVNAAFQRILGHKETDMMDTNYLELVHPDDLERSRAFLELVGTSDESAQYEVRVRHSDGSYIPMVWNVTGVPDAHVVLGLGIDISNLRAAERQEKADLAADLRRRQALQVNDDLTQGLVVAKYALEQGEIETAKEAVYATLRSAQRIAEGLLEDSGEHSAIKPGDLVRGKAASFEETAP